MTAWKYRKYIGLALLLMAIFTIYSIHKRALIKEGYHSCILENEEIIKELKKKSANEITNIRNDFGKVRHSIAKQSGGDTTLLMWSNAVARLHDIERAGGQ